MGFRWSMVLLSTKRLIRIWDIWVIFRVGCWVELISAIIWKRYTLDFGPSDYWNEMSQHTLFIFGSGGIWYWKKVHCLFFLWFAAFLCQGGEERAKGAENQTSMALRSFNQVLVAWGRESDDFILLSHWSHLRDGISSLESLARTSLLILLLLYTLHISVS